MDVKKAIKTIEMIGEIFAILKKYKAKQREALEKLEEPDDPWRKMLYAQARKKHDFPRMTREH